MLTATEAREIMSSIGKKHVNEMTQKILEELDQEIRDRASQGLDFYVTYLSQDTKVLCGNQVVAELEQLGYTISTYEDYYSYERKIRIDWKPPKKSFFRTLF